MKWLSAQGSEVMTLYVAVQIENMAYPVTVDAINTVFSTYGFVQKIAIFEKNNGWQVCSPQPSPFPCRIRLSVLLVTKPYIVNTTFHKLTGGRPKRGLEGCLVPSHFIDSAQPRYTCRLPMIFINMMHTTYVYCKLLVGFS